MFRIIPLFALTAVILSATSNAASPRPQDQQLQNGLRTLAKENTMAT